MFLFSKGPTSDTATGSESVNVNVPPSRRLTVLLGLLAVAVGTLAWRFPSLLEAYHHEQFRADFRDWSENNRNEAAAENDGRRATAQTPWMLDNATIPRDEIRSGGPPKDGIPALTKPKMIPAKAATYLSPRDRVIGVVIEKEARAYPLAIMNYHEIVNDTIGKRPIVATYCPLCDSAVVYDRADGDLVREFGVSGLLYNSNVLMYDRRGTPESLWSQLKAEGVSGPGASKTLHALPVELASWGEWRDRHPQTTVMSKETGHQRDYSRNPYAQYFETPQLMFPVKLEDARLPKKARVLGVWTKNASRAYPISSFGDKSRTVEESLDGRKFTLEFNAESSSLRVAKADDDVSWMYSLWFAWYAFHPETTVFQ